MARRRFFGQHFCPALLTGIFAGVFDRRFLTGVFDRRFWRAFFDRRFLTGVFSERFRRRAAGTRPPKRRGPAVRGAARGIFDQRFILHLILTGIF